MARVGPQRHEKTRLYKRIRKKNPDCLLGVLFEHSAPSHVISNLRHESLATYR